MSDDVKIGDNVIVTSGVLRGRVGRVSELNARGARVNFKSMSALLVALDPANW